MTIENLPLWIIGILKFLKIDKIIDSIRKNRESKKKIEDLEEQRLNENAANLGKTFGHTTFEKHFKNKADIIKKTNIK